MPLLKEVCVSLGVDFEVKTHTIPILSPSPYLMVVSRCKLLADAMHACLPSCCRVPHCDSHEPQPCGTMDPYINVILYK